MSELPHLDASSLFKRRVDASSVLKNHERQKRRHPPVIGIGLSSL